MVFYTLEIVGFELTFLDDGPFCIIAAGRFTDLVKGLVCFSVSAFDCRVRPGFILLRIIIEMG